MADIKTNLEWILNLSNKEISLIKRALRRALKEDEYDLAIKLDLDISLRQISQIKHLNGEFKKLEDNIMNEED